LNIGTIIEFCSIFATEIWFGAPLSFVLGMVLASFGGVIIDRLPHQMGWIENPSSDYTISSPRSQCNECRRTLGIIDLIPVFGWIINKGQCRVCHTVIPKIYPITELLIGTLFTLSYFYFRDFVFVFSAWVFIWSAFLISILDLKHHWIPSVISIPLLWFGLLFSPFEADVYLRLYGAFLGGSIMILTFWIVGRSRSENVYSGGDVMLASIGGAWLGILYLPAFLITSSIFFAAHCFWEKKYDREWVPFGPALCLSICLVVLFRSFLLRICYL
jgi:leader peptidase (prepilin peptidase)/N-methyltransferase